MEPVGALRQSASSMPKISEQKNPLQNRHVSAKRVGDFFMIAANPYEL
jgi:hypothetical protein